MITIKMKREIFIPDDEESVIEVYYIFSGMTALRKRFFCYAERLFYCIAFTPRCA